VFWPPIDTYPNEEKLQDSDIIKLGMHPFFFLDCDGDEHIFGK
jgi:hypothetical protein